MMTANGLAKLLEELGELAQVAAKRLAYFHTDEHPDGNGSLDERMQDEMGDVLAACVFVAHKFQLDDEIINRRKWDKLNLFQKWDADTTNGGDCFHASPSESVAVSGEVSDGVKAFERPRFGVFLADGSFEEISPDSQRAQEFPPPRWVGGAHDMQLVRAAVLALAGSGGKEA